MKLFPFSSYRVFVFLARGVAYTLSCGLERFFLFLFLFGDCSGHLTMDESLEFLFFTDRSVWDSKVLGI